MQSQKIDWILALVLLPTIRQGTAVPETEAPIISIENEKRVSKSECMLAGIKMVAKAGKSRCSARSRSWLKGRLRPRFQRRPASRVSASCAERVYDLRASSTFRSFGNAQPPSTNCFCSRRPSNPTAFHWSVPALQSSATNGGDAAWNICSGQVFYPDRRLDHDESWKLA